MLLINRRIFEVINKNNDHFSDIHCCQVTQKLLSAFSKPLQWLYSVLLQFSADICHLLNSFSFLIFFHWLLFFNYNFCISTHQILKTESLFMNPNYEFSSISEPSDGLKYKNSMFEQQRDNIYIQFLFAFYFLFLIFQKSFYSRLQYQIKIRD